MFCNECIENNLKVFFSIYFNRQEIVNVQNVQDNILKMTLKVLIWTNINK